MLKLILLLFLSLSISLNAFCQITFEKYFLTSKHYLPSSNLWELSDGFYVQNSDILFKINNNGEYVKEIKIPGFNRINDDRFNGLDVISEDSIVYMILYQFPLSVKGRTDYYFYFANNLGDTLASSSIKFSRALDNAIPNSLLYIKMSKDNKILVAGEKLHGRLSVDGKFIWEQKNIYDQHLGPYNTIQTADNNFVFVKFKSVTTPLQGTLTKINDAGGILWEKPISETGGFVCENVKGEFGILTERNIKNEGGFLKKFPLVFIKTNFIGDTIFNSKWNKFILKPEACFDDCAMGWQRHGYSINSTADNGFLISYIDTNNYLNFFKVDSSNNICWEKKYSNKKYLSSVVKQSKDLSVLGASMFYDSTLQSYGTAVFKFMDAITTNIPAISSKSNIVSISPNPSTNYFTISFTEEVAGEVEVFNNNGLLILQKKLNGTTKLNLNTSDLSNGIYFVKVLKEGKLFGTNKLIICN